MNVQGRIDSLAERLAGNGELTDGAWRAALHAVPRHLFVPSVAWAVPYEEPAYRIDRDRNSEAWWNAVYADQAIITQLDDGAGRIGDGEGRYTSSLSAPGVVVEFLELLALDEGNRVLEIGTGTGWTAGLLAHRLGDKNVVSVEIDQGVATAAAENLTAAGYFPHLVCGDGEVGWPERAPYDRVHVTAGVREVPYAWVKQSRPGGVIVFPWMPAFEPGHKVRLTVRRDGTASGRFAGGAGYMMLRGQRTPPAPQHRGGYRESTASLDPRRVFQAGHGLDVAVAGLLPDVCVGVDKGDPFQLWLWTGDSGAHVTGPEVEQFGPRDLWDEMEEAFFRWASWGQPERRRFGLSVTPVGQRVWLDSPDNPIDA